MPEFRDKNLLLADEDFAYAFASFASFEEAALGGDYLGQEWATARMEQEIIERLLMPAAAAAVEEPSSSAFRPPRAKSVAPVKHPVARLTPGKPPSSCAAC